MAKKNMLNAIGDKIGRMVPRHGKPSIPREVKPAAPIITIKGEGTLPVYVDGAMRRLPKGRPIAVSQAEKAVLDHANIPYTEK